MILEATQEPLFKLYKNFSFIICISMCVCMRTCETFNFASKQCLFPKFIDIKLKMKVHKTKSISVIIFSLKNDPKPYNLLKLLTYLVYVCVYFRILKFLNDAVPGWLVNLQLPEISNSYLLYEMYYMLLSSFYNNKITILLKEKALRSGFT